jgi:hypothetical protein
LWSVWKIAEADCNCSSFKRGAGLPLSGIQARSKVFADPGFRLLYCLSESEFIKAAGAAKMTADYLLLRLQP